MQPVIKQAVRSRWFVATVHAGLWFLLYLAVTNLRGKAPNVRDTDAVSNPIQSVVPVAGLERLFSPSVWIKPLSDKGTLDAFATRYFIPPAQPAPTTRKIEVTYQGFYQTANGPKHTILKLGDVFTVAPVGAPLATNLFIADATIETLTLTNLAAQTNILPLNTKKELVVPIR
jgi:hypothetical protein